MDSMILELEPIMTNYSQDDLILVASFMKGYQKLYKHKYYNSSAFDVKLISKVKHSILSEYYSV